uniref:PIH1 N-terminal domain-containing protein n=1 Tax=Psilocybe cubensis TaxID=181762 RepID=A0A8H7XQ20_PSICU
MSSTNVLRIELSPKPGFCIKSAALNPALLPPTASSPSPNILEPAPQPIPVPKGQKIFVNLAWDPNVPPPPDASEEEIKRAMQGEDAVDDANPSGWYVPVIVSNARQDKDKSGNPSLVFDCIFNSTVKSRTLRDPEFKIFLVELSLQRIEAQTGLELSRNIGTPNIASKGKLLPRSVHIPSHMVPALVGAPSPSPSPSTAGVSATPASKSNPLIQELPSSSPTNDRTLISPSSTSTSSAPATKPTTTSGSGPGSTLPGLKGILKKPSSAASSASATPGSASTRLDWSWTKEAPSGRLRIDVRVPGLTPTLITTSTLDIEPNRLVLSIPGHPTLDIDTSLSDAEIVARVAGSYSSSSSSSKSTGKANGRPKASASATALKSPTPTASKEQEDDADANENDDTAETEKDKETMRILTLKRQRDFALDDADAVWEVGSARVVVFL